MTGLSVQQSKQGGNNAARFVCKSARLATHSGELFDFIKTAHDHYDIPPHLQEWAATLIRKIEGKS